MNKQQNCEVNFTVFIVYLKYTIKANPSPNGNGFAFNLFGEPTVNYPNTLIPVKSSFSFVLSIS